MQHLKDLLEENGKKCFNTRVMHATISLDIVYLKVVEVAGKHILNIFSRFAVGTKCVIVVYHGRFKSIVVIVES